MDKVHACIKNLILQEVVAKLGALTRALPKSENYAIPRGRGPCQLCVRACGRAERAFFSLVPLRYDYVKRGEGRGGEGTEQKAGSVKSTAP